MTMYVLLKHEPNSPNEWVLGVFSSEEDAWKAVENSYYSRGWCSVEEYEVGRIEE